MPTKTKKKVRKKAKRAPSKPKKLPGKIVGEINGFPVRRLLPKQIKGADYNPRTITDNALDGLKRSVGEFGLPQAIVWNKRTQRVVGGHQRLRTLDPNKPTDVVEVDLDEEREKALNLTLNNAHITGDFTANLADLLAEIETAIPDLATDLHLGELYVDVPTEMDDLLIDDRGVERGGNEGDQTEKSVGDKEKGWESSDLRQIILILTKKEHEKATELLNEVMKAENLESFTAAVMWLLENYES